MSNNERDWTWLQLLDVPILGKAIMFLVLTPFLFLADCVGLINMGIKKTPPKEVVQEEKKEPGPSLKERAQDEVADFIKGVQKRLKD